MIAVILIIAIVVALLIAYMFMKKEKEGKVGVTEGVVEGVEMIH